jgi:pilus assembly protein CpaE
MEMPSIKNLKLVIETLKALNIPPKKLEFVLNKSDIDSGLNLFDVEKSLGKRFTTFIPSSPKVSISINKGVPIVMEDENDPASAAILRLSHRIEMLFEKSNHVGTLEETEVLHEPV